MVTTRTGFVASQISYHNRASPNHGVNNRSIRSASPYAAPNKEKISGLYLDTNSTLSDTRACGSVYVTCGGRGRSPSGSRMEGTDTNQMAIRHAIRQSGVLLDSRVGTLT